MDEDLLVSIVGYVAALALAIVLNRLSDRNAVAVKPARALLVVVLVYPGLIAVLFLCRNHLGESYAYIIYAALLTIVMGLAAGLLLLLWFVSYSGLWERRFRCSLRTVLLIVLAVAGLMSFYRAPVPRKCLFEVTGHEGPCLAAFFTDDGRWLVSVSGERAIVWDVRSRRPHLSLPLDHRVKDAAVRDGQLLLLGEDEVLTAHLIPGLEKVEEIAAARPLHAEPRPQSNVLARRGRLAVYLTRGRYEVLRWPPGEFLALLWYPQFWLCAILMPAVIWSLLRDRGLLSPAGPRSARRSPAPTCRTSTRPFPEPRAKGR